MKVAKRAILTNLSKASDCIVHNLLIAKLNANEFKKEVVGLPILSLLRVNKEPSLSLPLLHGKCYSLVCHKGKS